MHIELEAPRFECGGLWSPPASKAVTYRAERASRLFSWTTVGTLGWWGIQGELLTQADKLQSWYSRGSLLSSAAFLERPLRELSSLNCQLVLF
jgi:hypothetical protein